MTAPGVSAGQRSWRPVTRLVWALALLAMIAGCAAPARIEVPAELPLQTHEELFAIRWALQREATIARAVGVVRPSFDTEARLTLALFGVDAQGRIVSRGTAYLRSEFSRRSIPFAIEVIPVGREARFELRVVDYYVTGLRTN